MQFSFEFFPLSPPEVLSHVFLFGCLAAVEWQETNEARRAATARDQSGRVADRTKSRLGFENGSSSVLIDVINGWIWVNKCFLFFLEREKFKLRKQHFLYITNESRSQSDRNNYTM